MTILFSFNVQANGPGQPKYIFFFLGDGMASAQIQSAEAYLTTVNGGSARSTASSTS
ncbi:MAG TPA: hypothetical protein VLL97_02450 [Acidobacteriota bacterium]|nr:hypothetical protein [Acidobacteriota bacterium]